jgi:hypothetical protein
VCRGMGFFLAVRALHFVQNFVPLIHPGSGLLLASKRQRVLNITDDSPILKVQFRREIKLSRHSTETSCIVSGSRAGDLVSGDDMGSRERDVICVIFGLVISPQTAPSSAMNWPRAIR